MVCSTATPAVLKKRDCCRRRLLQRSPEVPAKRKSLSFASLIKVLVFKMLLKASFQRISKTKPSAVAERLFLFGWKMGFEPTTLGTTIRYSNQLSYIHRFRSQKYIQKNNSQNFTFIFCCCQSILIFARFEKRKSFMKVSLNKLQAPSGVQDVKCSGNLNSWITFPGFSFFS